MSNFHRDRDFFRRPVLRSYFGVTKARPSELCLSFQGPSFGVRSYAYLSEGPSFGVNAYLSEGPSFGVKLGVKNYQVTTGVTKSFKSSAGT